MITRRSFIAKGAMGAVALVGLAASQKINQLSASAQGNSDSSTTLRPQPARELHRVEAKGDAIQPEAWNVRTFQFVARNHTVIPAKTVLSNAMLRMLHLTPLGDPLPTLIVLPAKLTLWRGDTVSFTIDRSALKYNHAPDDAPYMIEFK